MRGPFDEIDIDMFVSNDIKQCFMFGQEKKKIFLILQALNKKIFQFIFKKRIYIQN